MEAAGFSSNSNCSKFCISEVSDHLGLQHEAGLHCTLCLIHWFPFLPPLVDSNSQRQQQQLQPADADTVVVFGGQALLFLFVLSFSLVHSFRYSNVSCWAFFLLTWTDSHCVSDAAVVKLQQFRIQRRVYSDFLNSCVQSDFQQRMGWVRVDRCCRALGWRGYGSHKVRWMNKWRASIRKHEALFKHSSQQRQCKLTTWNEQMHLSSIPE